MAAPEPKDHHISLATAAEMTKRYRDNFIKGGFFWKDQILEMLKEDSIGMRYYYGINEDGIKVIILTAVDADGNDIVNTDRLLEYGLKCPPTCSNPNQLNS